MKALADTVFVRPTALESERASGFIIPDAAQERPTQGVVVSAGEKAPVKEGDSVLFSRYAGQDVEIDGEGLVLLKAHDLLAVLYVH